MAKAVYHPPMSLPDPAFLTPLPNLFGHTRLHWAAISDDLPLAMAALATDPADPLDLLGRAPLHYACLFASEKTVRAIAAASCANGLPDRSGFTPFELLLRRPEPWARAAAFFSESKALRDLGDGCAKAGARRCL